MMFLLSWLTGVFLIMDCFLGGRFSIHGLHPLATSASSLRFLFLVHWILCDVVQPVDESSHHRPLVLQMVNTGVEDKFWYWSECLFLQTGFGGTIIINIYKKPQEWDRSISLLLAGEFDVWVDVI